MTALVAASLAAGFSTMASAADGFEVHDPTAGPSTDTGVCNGWADVLCYQDGEGCTLYHDILGAHDCVIG